MKYYRQRLFREIAGWVAVICAALAAGILITSFVIQRTIVYSCSMEPTLCEGDSLWVEKVTPRLGAIQRGDIVTIRAPEIVDGKNKSLIKRVVALEGDTVEISGGKVLVNGREISEEYVSSSYTSAEDERYSKLVVPKGCIYVLGDNRSIPIVDSRTIGPVEKSRIIGKAVMRMYPLNRFGMLH